MKLLFKILACIFFVTPAFAEMQYAEICEKPGVCKKVSRLIMGTDHLGKIPREKATEVLNEALNLGINAFDTAPIYADGIEDFLGDWSKSVNRQDLVLITKGGFPYDNGPGTYLSKLAGTSAEIKTKVGEELVGSADRLHPGIGIYLMHRDDMYYENYKKVDKPQTPVKTILEALSDPALRQKYGMMGVSNWETPRVDETQRVAMENANLVRPVCNSPYFSLLEMSDTTIHSGGVQVKHAEMMNPNFQKGVKIMPYSPLGGFTIFSTTWEKAKENARTLKNANERYWGHVYDAIFHDANEARVKRAVSFLEQFNKRNKTSYTLDQLVNAYALAHARTDFLIVGPRTVDALKRTVASMELAKLLTPADLDYLYTNPAPVSQAAPRAPNRMQKCVIDRLKP